MYSPHPDLNRATSLDKIGRYLFHWCDAQGLTTISATVMQVGRAPSRITPLHNLSSALEAYFRTDRVRDADPVMRHARESGVPLVWDRGTYQAAGCMDIWQALAGHGVCSGVVAAVHQPEGRQLVLRIDGPQARQHEPGRLAAEALQLVVQAQDVVFRALRQLRLQRMGAAPLDDAEVEVLRWAASGKTESETADIIGTTEAAVGKLLDSVACKLGAQSREGAIFKAFRAGLV